MKRKYRWVVEFTIDEVWVADGFRMTDEDARDMISDRLPHSYSHETDAKVLESPPVDELAKAGDDSESIFDEEPANEG